MTIPAGKRPRQFTLRFLFMLTALSVGQPLIMELQTEWRGYFMLYVFIVGVAFGVVFSTERGGPGSFFYAAIWAAVSLIGAWLGLLRDGWNAEIAWRLPFATAWAAFWGDVIGGVSAWCWRSTTRALNAGFRRRPHDSRRD